MARSTISPGKALEVQSRVPPFMSLDYKKDSQLVKYEEEEEKSSCQEDDPVDEPEKEEEIE